MSATAPAPAPGDDGHAGDHRLDERDPESFVRRERQVDVGGGEVGGERRVRHLAGDADRTRQSEVVDEPEQRLVVLVARGAPDEVEAGPGVVEAAVGPQRLDELVLRLGGHDPAHEEDVGPAAGAQAGQLGGHPRIRGGRDAPVVGQDGHDGRAPAARTPELLLAEPALGQAEQGLRGEQCQLLGRPGGPLHAAGLPAVEVLGAGEVVEVQDQGQPVLGQVGRHGGGRRELVDGDVAPGRVLGVHPVLVGQLGQVVVDRLGEDLRAPAGRPQGVAQLEGVRPRGVVRVQGGDELVDGHRPPGGGAHRSAGGYGVAMLARTAVTR